jgi:hypothetical protein
MSVKPRAEKLSNDRTDSTEPALLLTRLIVSKKPTWQLCATAERMNRVERPNLAQRIDDLAGQRIAGRDRSDFRTATLRLSASRT